MKYVLLLLSCLLLNESSKSNTIHFEKSPYGLLFTDVEINGQKVKAMIDFGDPNYLQLSSSLVSRQEIQVKKTKAVAMDVFGNSFDINKGIVKTVKIGNNTESNVEFSSSPNEMESVASQINTEFHAVIGWGYFKTYFTEINYANNTFTLTKEEPIGEEYLFHTPFDKNSNYLNIPVHFNQSKANLILDTGSPVSVIDSSYYQEKKLQSTDVSLGGKEVDLDFYIQNLSVLKSLNANGILGGDFLGKYTILIDPFEKTLYFK